MKAILIILVASLCFGSTASAQKRKKPAPRTPARTSQPRPSAPRVIGSTVTIITKNGDRITGELLDLSAYSIRFRSGNLESVLALDTIDSVSFGSSQASGARQEQRTMPAGADFLRDAEVALRSFQTMASDARTGIDYTDYGRALSELRHQAEQFIEKHSTTDNTTEARVIALLSGALTDYSWSRTIWTLKLGRSSDGTVTESDSPAVADTLVVYPDLRAQAASGNRLSAEKLVAGLWNKAADKINRARSMLSSTR